MKVFYKKKKPKVIQCRSYKNFDNHLSQRELNSELLKTHLNNADLSEFTEIFLSNLTSMFQKNKSLYEQITCN